MVAFLLGSLALHGFLGLWYVLTPKFFYFRAWEYFDVLVYHGWSPASDTFVETGDAARSYLFQRYWTRTRVSLNRYGNRRSLIETEAIPNVLMLGDSQLFGSGVSDEDVVAWILAQKTGVPVYNGSRMHGIELLQHPSLRFRSVIFTSTEWYSLFWSYCDPAPTPEILTDKLPISSFVLTRPSLSDLGDVVGLNAEYLYGVVGNVLTKALGSGPLYAPERRFVAVHDARDPRFLKRDVACAKELSALLGQNGIRSGFFYFPNSQTIYGKEAGLNVDPFTRDYIDVLTESLTNEGLLTFNSKACLLDNHGVSVYQMHDTHINGAGHRLLADCLLRSPMRQLFD